MGYDNPRQLCGKRYCETTSQTLGMKSIPVCSDNDNDSGRVEVTSASEMEKEYYVDEHAEKTLATNLFFKRRKLTNYKNLVTKKSSVK